MSTGVDADRQDVAAQGSIVAGMTLPGESPSEPPIAYQFSGESAVATVDPKAMGSKGAAAPRPGRSAACRYGYLGMLPLMP